MWSLHEGEEVDLSLGDVVEILLFKEESLFKVKISLQEKKK
jgi:hypothetical protein